MRITNNMVTSSIMTELQQLETQQSSLQTEVSSGLAVTQPSDNPQAFSQVIELQGQSDQIQQFDANATQALNVANASYAGLSSLQQIYDRASQLGTLATSAVDGTSQQAYATEVDQLIQQAVQVGNSQLGGSYLFAGTADSSPPISAATDASGTITAVSYAGNSGTTPIPISATSTVVPATSGETNSGIADFINNLISLRDALQSGDATGIGTANTNLSSSEDVITTAVADNGAIQARIQSDQTQQQAMATQDSTMISNAADADLPTTMVQLNQAQLAYQAALQSSASVMHLSILNYINLQ
jgi:flagellar hook-associated protein 3 FlgL